MRVILSGPGLVGLDHLKNIANHQDIELVGLVAPDQKKHDACAYKYQVPRFTSVEKACKSLAPDGVIISSPTKCHFEQFHEALLYTPYIMLEKPIFSENTEISSIQHFDLTKICVGHHRHSGSQLQAIRRFVNSGELGELVAISGHAVFKKPEDYFKAGPWRLKKGGGGVLDINMIHEIGVLRALGGEICEVSAFIQNKRPASEVEDTAVINFKFRSNLVGSFVVSDRAVGNMSWEHNSNENSFFPNTKRSSYFVYGTEGMLEFPNTKIIKYEGKPSWIQPTTETIVEVPIDTPLKKIMDNFYDVYRGLEPPNVSFIDGLNNLRVIEAVKQSAKTGCAIKVDNL